MDRLKYHVLLSAIIYAVINENDGDESTKKANRNGKYHLNILKLICKLTEKNFFSN